MSGLLFRVKTKMNIFAHRRTLDLLEGGYSSIHRGRSHDFDDLRAYVPGDEVKDIDWKATARHGEPLVKRYIASRRHGLVLVMDTGRNMAATAAGGESKKDIAIMAAGALAYIAAKHGDIVSLAAGDESGTVWLPSGQRDEHLERLLRVADRRIDLDGAKSDVVALLDSVAKGIRTRSMLLVVTDDVRLDERAEKILRRLRARHEVLWLTIGDADLMKRSQGRGPRGQGDRADSEVYDVQGVSTLPAYIRADAELRRLFDRSSDERVVETEQELRQLGVSSHRVASQAEVVPGLFTLLEKHRRAR